MVAPQGRSSWRWSSHYALVPCSRKRVSAPRGRRSRAPSGVADRVPSSRRPGASRSPRRCSRSLRACRRPGAGHVQSHRPPELAGPRREALPVLGRAWVAMQVDYGLLGVLRTGAQIERASATTTPQSSRESRGFACFSSPPVRGCERRFRTGGGAQGGRSVLGAPASGRVLVRSEPARRPLRLWSR
jgi:hypothetical protein